MQFLWGLLASVAGQEVVVEPRAEAGTRWLYGIVRFDEKPVVGDRLDVRSDLGWTDPAIVPALGLDVRLDRHTLGGSFQLVRFSGTAVFDTPSLWNEHLFPAGEEIRSKIYLDEADVEYRYAVVAADALTFEAGVCGRYLRIFIHLDSPSVGADGDNLGAFVPEADLRFSFRVLPTLRAEARFAGSAFSASGLRARSGSVRVGPRWILSSLFAAEATFEAGLLQLINHGATQRNEVDVKTLGVSVSFEARF